MAPPSSESGSRDGAAIAVTWTVDHARVAAEGGPDDAGVRRVVAAALREGGRDGVELSVVLVDDPTLTELHRVCLGDPRPTDVMSFDLGDEDAGPVGEVIVSVDRARAVAKERGVPFARELALYLAHGTLHLCGHDDGDEGARAAMRVAERRVLDSLGFAPDDAPHDVDPVSES